MLAWRAAFLFLIFQLVAMYSFEEIQKKVEAGIEGLHFPYPPKSLYEPIAYILSLGGKRIRPALVLMAYNLYRDDVERAMSPAMGLEVFHNFTLLHDDLMDEADMRRNRPTVHKVWNANTAILSGDAMLIAAYRLVGDTEPKYLKAVLDLFTQTALEICGGQQYDMEFESRMDVTEDEYMEMIRLKTAVLLACGLKMGAILSEAPAADVDNLYRFGINIGLAFQLQDDLLDVYGDPKTFGKNIGGDILCNKKTFLLINAFQRATGEQKAALEQWVARKDFDAEEKIAVVTGIYNALNLKKLSEERMQQYYAEAMKNLASLSVGKEKRAELEKIASRLMNRQS